MPMIVVPLASLKFLLLVGLKYCRKKNFLQYFHAIEQEEFFEDLVILLFNEIISKYSLDSFALPFFNMLT